MTEHPDSADRAAAALLSPLAGEPAGPARIDVARAMAEGNRRRRTRWWASLAAIGAVTATTAAGGTLAFSAVGRPAPPPPIASPSVSAASAGPAPADCTVSGLSVPGADSALVAGGDSSGRWLVGRAFLPGDKARVVVWRDGKIVAGTEVPNRARFADINASGAAVGGGSASGRQPSAYRDGTMSTLVGGEGTAKAINDAGVVVGALGPAQQVRPVRWPSVTAQPEQLPLPPGTRYGTAVDVDDAGTVIGTVTTDGNPESQMLLPVADGVGYLWLADGSGRPFPLPDVNGRPADRFEPLAIRNGWVVGQGIVQTRDGLTLVPLRYRIDTDHYERVIAPARMMLPDRVAATGAVPTGGRQPAIIDAAGAITLLPTDPAQGKDAGYELTSLSDDGRTVAGGLVGGAGGSRPLLWRCR